MNVVKRIKQRYFSKIDLADFAEVERYKRIFYLNYLREEMTVFDVGANVGELTLLFSRFVGGGTVHAFEASSETFNQLKTVCQMIGKHNIILNNLALSEKLRKLMY